MRHHFTKSFRPKTGRALLKSNNKNDYNRKNKINKDLYGEDWEELSRFIKQRDDYTCQISKISNKIVCTNRFPPPFSHLLHAHHIIPLPRGSNHPSNLVTLCKSCHGFVHNKNFGKITEKQIIAANRRK